MHAIIFLNDASFMLIFMQAEWERFLLEWFINYVAEPIMEVQVNVCFMLQMHKVLIPYFLALCITPATHSLEGTLMVCQLYLFLVLLFWTEKDAMRNENQ